MGCPGGRVCARTCKEDQCCSPRYSRWKRTPTILDAQPKHQALSDHRQSSLPLPRKQAHAAVSLALVAANSTEISELFPQLPSSFAVHSAQISLLSATRARLLRARSLYGPFHTRVAVGAFVVRRPTAAWKRHVRCQSRTLRRECAGRLRWGRIMMRATSSLRPAHSSPHHGPPPSAPSLPNMADSVSTCAQLGA